MTGPRTVAASVERRLVLGVLAGGVVIGGWGLAPPEIASPKVSSADRALLNIGASLLFGLVVVLPWARLSSRRLLTPLRAWIESDREPTPDECRILLAQPLRQARWTLVWWAMIAVWVPMLNTRLVYASGTYPLLRVQLQIAVAAFLSFAITHALVEDALRPQFSRAFSRVTFPTPRANGLGVRALLLWGAAAAAPLASMAILIAGLDGRELVVARSAIYLMSAIGVVVGGFVSFLGSRPVINGLRSVHSGLNAVAAGDLDASLPADSPGEIGLLHSRFNLMVDQLRERRRVEELFGTYVGAEVARLVADVDAAAVTPSTVTVLVTDVIGSSRLALDLDATEVVSMLNDFFEEVVGAVSTEGGWVARFEGDGAVCVFGAPIPAEDHAERALRVAADVRARTLALATKHPRLDAAIGIATGGAVAATVGAASRSEYSIIGPPVVAAAAMCDQAKQVANRIAVASSPA
ncbi:MAG: adenylate/guanylate cyclase domain-containing protein [Acidimicrobiales bacterium]|nr:adenylate/guanylate cyclase domain-containing protein [Acidimicrobiales bacterium]